MSAISGISAAQTSSVQTQVATQVAKIAQDSQAQVAEQLIEGIEDAADYVQEAGKGEHVDTLA